MRKSSALFVTLSLILATIGVVPVAATQPADRVGEIVEAVDSIPAATEGLERSQAARDSARGGPSPSQGAPAAAVAREIVERMSPRFSAEGFEVRPGLHSYYEGESSDSVTTDVGKLYQDVGPANDLVSQGLSDDRARHLLILQDSDAGTEHRFGIEFDYGPIELEMSDEGGVSVLLQEVQEDPTIVEGEEISEAPDPRDEPVELAQIEAPWAYDADGNEVATSYRIEGDTVIQTVEHLDVESYPIVADTTYSCGLANCTMWFNRNETNLIASFGAGAAGVVRLPFSKIAAADCLAAGTSYQGTANYHYNRGGCLYVRHLPWAPPPANIPWAGGHYDAACWQSFALAAAAGRGMRLARSDAPHRRPLQHGLLARSIIAAAGLLLLYLMSRAVPAELHGAGSILIGVGVLAVAVIEERLWYRRREDDLDAG